MYGVERCADHFVASLARALTLLCARFRKLRNAFAYPNLQEKYNWKKVLLHFTLPSNIIT